MRSLNILLNSTRLYCFDNLLTLCYEWISQTLISVLQRVRWQNVLIVYAKNVGESISEVGCFFSKRFLFNDFWKFLISDRKPKHNYNIYRVDHDKTNNEIIEHYIIHCHGSIGEMALRCNCSQWFPHPQLVMWYAYYKAGK